MTTQCSYSTLGVSTDNDLDDPAEMSSLAIMAELRVRYRINVNFWLLHLYIISHIFCPHHTTVQYYGAEIPQGADRDKQEQALIAARQDANNVGSSLATAQEEEHEPKDDQNDLSFEDLIVKLLDDDHRVTAIDLSGNRIRLVDVLRLADALMDNTRVHQLWLRGCDICNTGAKALASCLEQNMSIVDLFLDNNHIGNEGLVAISDALATSNQCLVSLDLDGNDISAEGLEAFTRALSTNSSLLVASFENNPISTTTLNGYENVALVQAMLTEKRSSMGLFDFVVDVHADDDSTSNLDHMSECSSYMPSTCYTEMGNGLEKKMENGLEKKMENGLEKMGNGLEKTESSFRFSVYNKANKHRRLIMFRIKIPKILRKMRGKKGAQSSMSKATPVRSMMNQRRQTDRSITTRRSSNSGSRSGSGPTTFIHQTGRLGYQSVRNTRYRRFPGQQNHDIIDDFMMHPDFNAVNKQLWCRIETMKLANSLAAEHYKARHHWFWFFPISSIILTVMLLCLASALELAGVLPIVVGNVNDFRLGISVSCILLSGVAFALAYLQTQFTWSSNASVHRSTELEVIQVAHRLDKLCRYEGRGSASSNHSTNADSMRELYKIDVYLQTMQRCTPPIPEELHETFRLLAHRLKRICTNNPHSVRVGVIDELIAGMGDSNPVPLEVHIDAMEILGKEIDESLFFPLIFPHSSDVVTRTIDALFARRAEDKENDDSESSDSDDEELGQSRPIYHHTERGLPLGWFEGVARDSGEKYYYNIETGMSSWERPVLENHQLKPPENEIVVEGDAVTEDPFKLAAQPSVTAATDVDEFVQLSITESSVPEVQDHQLKSPENEKFAQGGELAEDTSELAVQSFVTHADVAEVLVEPCETGFLLPVVTNR